MTFYLVVSFLMLIILMLVLSYLQTETFGEPLLIYRVDLTKHKLIHDEYNLLKKYLTKQNMSVSKYKDGTIGSVKEVADIYDFATQKQKDAQHVLTVLPDEQLIVFLGSTPDTIGPTTLTNRIVHVARKYLQLLYIILQAYGVDRKNVDVQVDSQVNTAAYSLSENEIWFVCDNEHNLNTLLDTYGDIYVLDNNNTEQLKSYIPFAISKLYKNKGCIMFNYFVVVDHNVDLASSDCRMLLNNLINYDINIHYKNNYFTIFFTYHSISIAYLRHLNLKGIHRETLPILEQFKNCICETATL